MIEKENILESICSSQFALRLNLINICIFIFIIISLHLSVILFFLHFFHRHTFYVKKIASCDPVLHNRSWERLYYKGKCGCYEMQNSIFCCWFCASWSMDYCWRWYRINGIKRFIGIIWLFSLLLSILYYLFSLIVGFFCVFFYVYLWN